MGYELDKLRAVKVAQRWTQEDIERVFNSTSRCSLCRLCKDPDTGFIKVRSRGANAPNASECGQIH